MGGEPRICIGDFTEGSPRNLIMVIGNLYRLLFYTGSRSYLEI